MPMPYQVVGKGPYQIQMMHNGKWANLKGMEFETASEAYKKFSELIEADMIKRIPADELKKVRQAAHKFIKDKAK